MAGEEKTKKKKYTRRDFVVGSGSILAGGTLAVYSPAAASAATSAESSEKKTYAKSAGYLVYDSRQCSGCQSCMLACSLVHEGKTSLSLSRIQVSRAVLTPYPYDIQIAVCRQCPDPLCVKNCPTGACHVSEINGNVRMINTEKCIGCQACIKACPHHPHRTVWNSVTRKSAKCDLCSDAAYYNGKGGPSGSQACVSVCPMGALKLVHEMPSQADIGGYDVDLAPPTQPKAVPEAGPKTAGH
jgi:protein NrfC